MGEAAEWYMQKEMMASELQAEGKNINACDIDDYDLAEWLGLLDDEDE